MVIGTPDIDERPEAAFKFIAMVSNICRQIRWLAILPNDDAILIVTVVCRAEPKRAVFLVDGTILSELGDRIRHLSRMQRTLAEPDVETHIKT